LPLCTFVSGYSVPLAGSDWPTAVYPTGTMFGWTALSAASLGSPLVITPS
jgi:hypothetical protein